MVLLSRSDEKYKMHLTMTALDSLTAAALLKTTQRGRQRGDPLHSWKVRERDRYWTRDPGSQPMLVSPPPGPAVSRQTCFLSMHNIATMAVSTNLK